jgi:hypothetical protein
MISPLATSSACSRPTSAMCYGSSMNIYAYSSRKDPDVLGFTSDITGRNLPGKYAPWQPSNAGATIVTGGGDDPVSVAVQGVGYFIARDRSVP